MRVIRQCPSMRPYSSSYQPAPQSVWTGLPSGNQRRSSIAHTPEAVSGPVSSISSFVTVMDGDRTVQELRHHVDEAVAAAVDAAARAAHGAARHIDLRIRGEHLADALPVLLVEHAKVTGLELANLLDVFHGPAFAVAWRDTVSLRAHGPTVPVLPRAPGAAVCHAPATQKLA